MTQTNHIINIKGGGEIRRLLYEILRLADVFPILPRGFSAIFFECFGKVTLGGKTEVVCNKRERFITVAEEAFCLLYFFF